MKGAGGRKRENRAMRRRERRREEEREIAEDEVERGDRCKCHRTMNTNGIMFSVCCASTEIESVFVCVHAERWNGSAAIAAILSPWSH